MTHQCSSSPHLSWVPWTVQFVLTSPLYVFFESTYINNIPVTYNIIYRIVGLLLSLRPRARSFVTLSAEIIQALAP